jgi:putative phosphoribosyl transferase
MLRAILHPWAVDGTGFFGRTPLFANREEAGIRLAERLEKYRGAGALVLGIPRGGVPVAAAVARAIEGELDVVVARKLGAPISEELAIGAVTADGGRFLNDQTIRDLDVDADYIERVTKEQRAEAAARELRFRAGAPPPAIAGRSVIVVDDGLATGATMIAAARSVRAQKPARLVVAVPVGSLQACQALAREADDVVCLSTPEPFVAVGLFYRDFGQTEDSEVEQLLGEARAAHPAAAGPAQ